MPQVNVVLSGMSETDQVLQNLEYANRAHAGMLTEAERKAIEQAGNLMRQKVSVPCTACGYCNVCPQEIAIPEIFEIYNAQQLNGNYLDAKNAYWKLGEKTAQNCVSCGACVKQCPQQIEIFQKLADIHQEYA